MKIGRQTYFNAKTLRSHFKTTSNAKTPRRKGKDMLETKKQNMFFLASSRLRGEKSLPFWVLKQVLRRKVEIGGTPKKLNMFSWRLGVFALDVPGQLRNNGTLRRESSHD